MLVHGRMLALLRQSHDVTAHTTHHFESLSGITAYLRWKEFEDSPRTKLVRVRVNPMLIADKIGVDHSSWSNPKETRFHQMGLTDISHLSEVLIDAIDEARAVSYHYTIAQPNLIEATKFRLLTKTVKLS